MHIIHQKHYYVYFTSHHEPYCKTTVAFKMETVLSFVTRGTFALFPLIKKQTVCK